VSELGAEGTGAVGTAETLSEYHDLPALDTAATLNEYDTPFDNPITDTDVAVETASTYTV
jgi:hypothetical protein